MHPILIVALGGAAGSAARYMLSSWTAQHTSDWRFPLGTFLVNVIGCFVIGVLAGLATKHQLMSAEARLLLFSGLMGGFTTFSSFGLETFQLLRRAEFGVAGGYVLLSVAVGLVLLWLGFQLVPQKS